MSAVFALVVGALVAATPVHGQAPQRSSKPQSEPFRYSFTVGLENVGLDTNPTSDSREAKRDTTADLRVQFEPSVRVGRLTASGRIGATGGYFRHYAALRSLDTDNALRVELRLRRFAVTGAGSYLRTREPFGPEFDIQVPRTEGALETGIEVWLTGKSSIGVYLRRDFVDFEADALVEGTSLQQALSRSGEMVTLVVRNAITPLTTVLAQATAQREDFDYSAVRNTESTRLTGGLEFKPAALLQGRVLLGVRRMIPGAGGEARMDGVIASMNLGYYLTDSIRVAGRYESDFTHALRVSERYYRATALGGSVEKRFSTRVSLLAAITRQTTDYGTEPPIDVLTGDHGSGGVLTRTTRFSTTARYRLRDSTVLGLTAEYSRLRSMSAREFDRVRALTSITHRF